MRIEKENRNVSGTGFNSFGQFYTTLDQAEIVTYFGSLEEMLELSKEKWICVARSEETEFLFPAWDRSSKWAVVGNGESKQHSDLLREIEGAGTYVPMFKLEA